MTSLRQHIRSNIEQVLGRRPSAWIVWCDPRGDWAALLRSTLSDTDIGLLEVETRVAGQLGGPADRARIQEHIAGSRQFVLRVTARPEELGWLWAQALRAEQMYDRTLRSQLNDWGWRPQVLHLSDDEVRALAEQNLDLDPANWGSGGLEPNLDLLLSYLLLGATVEGTQRVVLNLSAERAGLGQPEYANPDVWRARAVARLLVTDAHRRAPGLISEQHDLLIAPTMRPLALQLIDRWLDSRVYSARRVLQTAIDDADPIAALDSQLAQADAAVGPFLSRRAEQAVYMATCKHVAALDGRDLLEVFANLQPAIARHCGPAAIWSQSDSEGGTTLPWNELSRLAGACRKLVSHSPAGRWPSPQAALDWYCNGGWHIDHAGEEILRNLATPDPALLELLKPLREAYRARWEQQLMEWSDVWQAAGSPTPDYPSAGERLAAFLQARRPTAIVIVDALRYDLGQLLARGINAHENGERATVQPARAPLPSITALGMGMALPIPADTLTASHEHGAWALREQGQEANLSQSSARRSWWATRGHAAPDAQLSVADVLNRDVPKPAKNRPRIVVTDRALDDQGHDGELEARGSQELVQRYVQVIQRLRDAGWLRIAVVTDHGYIHWSGQHDQRVPAPEGPIVYSSRRAAAYKPGSAPRGAWQTAPGGLYPVAVPSGASCFAAYGKRGYFHGGASLQEWVIPFVEVDWPARARPVELMLREQPSILSQRPRVTVLVPQVMFPEQYLARDIRLAIVHAETRAVLFASDPQTIRPTDQGETTVELVGLARPGAVAARGTSLIIEIRDAASDAVIDSTPSRLMIELRQTDDLAAW